MIPITMPKHPELSELVPLGFSADGQKNSFCMRCDAQEQTMSYAACLWRQSVLGKANVRTPSDWAGCSEAAKQGRCVAILMQAEEATAERSIFFRKRCIEAHPMAEPKRAWHSSALGKVASVVKSAADAVLGAAKSAAAPTPRGVFDVDTSGDYSKALSAAVEMELKHSTPAPAPAPKAARPAITALPGESPLAMARRIAALRKEKAEEL